MTYNRHNLSLPSAAVLRSISTSAVSSARNILAPAQHELRGGLQEKSQVAEPVGYARTLMAAECGPAVPCIVIGEVGLDAELVAELLFPLHLRATGVDIDNIAETAADRLFHCNEAVLIGADLGTLLAPEFLRRLLSGQPSPFEGEVIGRDNSRIQLPGGDIR